MHDPPPQRPNFNPRPPRGGRPCLAAARSVSLHFNPRPPRGGRLAGAGRAGGGFAFQSTPPARGATSRLSRRLWPTMNFNPRPPRGGRHCILSCGRFMLPFQSTPPARGATDALYTGGVRLPISIHAPREGGDVFVACPRSNYSHFNPRPPRGGRPLASQPHGA